ncbi:MAG TPA: YnfA family protein [Cellvibrionaceae bacterium]|nr:YnfA family protein [Cellvibrionaceae bacterium]
MSEFEWVKALGLYAITAVAELLGCYLPLLWLSGKGSAWLIIPATISLMVFVYLLSLHPAASGRVYATYGAIYIAIAIFWLWLVDGITPIWSDWVGVSLALAGAVVIGIGKRSA